MYRERFMKSAFEEALKGIGNDEGGPFGAVVVIGGEIVGRGHNTVIMETDPTSHAEINAIRDASRNMKRISLEDAIIYSTCEPCPMCLSAIYWAGIPTVYYSMDRFDAEKMGFSDAFIYRELSVSPDKRKVLLGQHSHPDMEKLMKEWNRKENPLSY